MKIPHRKKTARFFKGFFTPVAVLLAVVGLSASVLYRAGEYMPMADISAKVAQSGGVFGSALHFQSYWYKQEVYRRIKPEVATLGSSRTLLLRQDHFNKPFANLGLMTSIDEEMEIAEALFEDHAPKILLLEAPWWWFHGAPDASATKRGPATVKPGMAELLQPLRWVFSGKTTPAETLRLLLKQSPSVGVTGILQDQGYDAYGSYRYTASLTGLVENGDKKFKGTIDAMNGGDKAFLGAQHVSAAQWKKFTALLDYLQSKNIHIHFFVPPVAPAIIGLMDKEGSKFAYMKELSAKLETEMQKRGIGYNDFHDPASLGATECEFIDGLHGGYITMDRQLQKMAADDKTLAAVVKANLLATEIRQNAGKASTLPDEIDSLDLGCKR